MFKSLQNLPGSITIFHSSTNSASNTLLFLLKKHSIAPVTPKAQSFLQRLTNSKSTQSEAPSLYQIDVSTLPPTKEQYVFIRDSVTQNALNKASILKLFPKLINPEPGFGSMPSSSEYKLKLENDSSNFVPPLVVDWDHSLLATDEQGVQQIIDEFQKQSSN